MTDPITPEQLAKLDALWESAMWPLGELVVSGDNEWPRNVKVVGPDEDDDWYWETILGCNEPEDTPMGQRLPVVTARAQYLAAAIRAYPALRERIRELERQVPRMATAEELRKALEYDD